MYIQYQNDQFFLPFSVNCFTNCNVSNNASLVSARAGGGWSAKWGQAWTGGGGGVPKIPKFVGTSFMDDPLNRKTTGETHLRLWHHLGLILKKVSSSFITNMLSICIFIGLVRFEDKDFWMYGGDPFFVVVAVVAILVIICWYFCYFYHLLSFLLLLLSLLFLLWLALLALFFFISIYIVFTVIHLFLLLFLLLLSSRLLFLLSKIWLLPLLSSSLLSQVQPSLLLLLYYYSYNFLLFF